MSELPKGWVHTQLKNIGNLVTGNTPSRQNLSYYGDFVPFIKPGDIEKDKMIISSEEGLSSNGCEKARVLKDGSILVTCIGNIGRVGLAMKPVATNQQINSIELDDYILPKYAFYYCRTLGPWLRENASATTVAIINKGRFSEAPFILPPQAEQTRIVEKLDEVLAQVDTIKARLDGIPAILKRFRQSVLAAAVSGRLTEDEFKPNAFLTLGETGIEIKTGPFGSALHKSDYIEAGISVINPMHINDGFIQPSTQMTITQEKFSSLSAWHLKNGDVVVGRRGEMGRAAVVRNIESRPLLCGTGSMILRGNENINPDYLCFIIRSPVAVSYFNSTSVGSTMVNLNQQVIKKLRVYFPSLSKQKEIVSLVNQYFAFADTIEAQVKKAQARVNNLTQSILAKAFRGELVAQDPSDEPAEKLLERIAQARKEAEALAKAAKKVAKTK